MKPQARIQAVVDILEKMPVSRVPLDSVVGDYMRQRRYIGAKDRAAVAQRIYEMARNTARVGWWLAKIGAEDTPRNRMIAFLALCENADEKRFKDMYDGSSYAPEPLSPAELKIIKALEGQTLEHKDMPLSVRAECPPQYEESLKAYFGDAFEAELRAMVPGASLDLRVNTVLISRENAKQSLEKDGVETDETTYAPLGLRCRAKAYLAKTKAFAKGWIEIQDEGSQLIGHLCGAQPGMQVLDYCAGGGGKTLVLAADMSVEGRPKGRIVAMDLDELRLLKGRERFKKARVSDIIEPRPLSEIRHRKWLRRQKGTFDIVLCDVPCTGTGTWRRNPDMRWNIYGPALEELVVVQADILDKVAHTLKSGGRLIYATCSLLPEENENQIEAFLKRHEGFEIEVLDKARGLGTPYMRLTPHRHGTDGFFAAVLMKK